MLGGKGDCFWTFFKQWFLQSDVNTEYFMDKLQIWETSLAKTVAPTVIWQIFFLIINELRIIWVNLGAQVIPDYSCVMSVSQVLIQNAVKPLGRIFFRKQSKALGCWLLLLGAPSWVFEWVLHVPLVYDCLFLWILLA